MPLTLSKLIVESDSREHYPIPFPANLFVRNQWTDWQTKTLPVQVVRTTLYYGDYRLRDFPSCCVVERKASFGELAKNLFDPRDTLRCGRAFARLQKQALHPYLLLEMSLSEFFRSSGDPSLPTPEELLHRLYLASAQCGFSLLWVPRTSDRRLLGINLLHLMLAHALTDNFRVPAEKILEIPEQSLDKPGVSA